MNLPLILCFNIIIITIVSNLLAFEIVLPKIHTVSVLLIILKPNYTQLVNQNDMLSQIKSVLSSFSFCPLQYDLWSSSSHSLHFHSLSCRHVHTFMHTYTHTYTAVSLFGGLGITSYLGLNSHFGETGFHFVAWADFSNS